MKSLHTVAFAACLAFAAGSCSSDSKSAATTAPSGASTASTAAAENPATTAAAGSSDNTTDAGSETTAAAETLPGADITDLSPIQAKALATTLTTAAAFGLEIDSACLAAVLVQMSDADAQLLVDAKVGEDPALSPAGEALSDDAAKCVTSTGTATLTTTGSS